MLCWWNTCYTKYQPRDLSSIFTISVCSTYRVEYNYNPFTFYLQRCRLISSAAVLWSAGYGNGSLFFLLIFLLTFLPLLFFLRDNTPNPLLSKAAEKRWSTICTCSHLPFIRVGATVSLFVPATYGTRKWWAIVPLVVERAYFWHLTLRSHVGEAIYQSGSHWIWILFLWTKGHLWIVRVNIVTGVKRAGFKHHAQRVMFSSSLWLWRYYPGGPVSVPLRKSNPCLSTISENYLMVRYLLLGLNAIWAWHKNP